jgi:ABC-2 type transport system ATP-binding protein
MNPDTTPILLVESFTKSYGNFTAVENLTFAVEPGEIVGLVGTNGAGKTTTLRATSAILRPSSGSIHICGHNLATHSLQAKQVLAYIPDQFQPYDLLTVTEHLHFIALAYRVSDAQSKYEGLLEELELTAKRHEPASTLSRGMLQKLSLACAFLRDPRIVILDEPLTGLDPRGIRNIKASIRRRAALGTAFLLSSHLLDLVEALCDQVLILHKGRKLAFGRMEEVRRRSTTHDDASLEDVFFAITESHADGSLASTEL